MAQRRKNQPKIQSLSLVARFLNHVCEQEGFTQARLAKKIGTSTATLSRWFRDTLPPSEDDLKSVAKVTKIPVENFYALRVLDNLGTNKAMGSASAATQFLATGSRTFIYAGGLTMISGATQFRESILSKKMLLLNTLNPLFKPAPNEIKIFNKKVLANLKASWLAMAGILDTLKKNQSDLHLRLIVRDNVAIKNNPHIRELVANDFIALESSEPSHIGKSYSVHFYDCDFWVKHIVDLINESQLLQKHTNKQILVWDSKVSNHMDDKFVQDIISSLTVELVI